MSLFDSTKLDLSGHKTWDFVIILVFIIINILLFSFSVEKIEDSISYSATYWNASDGQRYWGVAVNLVEKSEFSMWTARDEPLSRAGPLPAMLFALPIKLLGFENAPILIVFLQCVLLYVIGLLTRWMMPESMLLGRFAQALVIFNPNLVGLAHHAQSDLLFTFFLTVILYVGSKIIFENGRTKFVHFICLGIAAGCLALSRPAGQYYALLFPFFLAFALIVGAGYSRVNWKRFLSGAIIYAGLFCMLTLPWALRNQAMFSDFGLSQSEGIMMRDQYKFLLRSIGVEKQARAELLDSAVDRYLRDKNLDLSCNDRFKDNDCKLIVSRAYLDAISERTIQELAKGLASAWSVLYFSGSASRISDYVGLEVSNIHKILLDKFDGLQSFKEYLSAAREYGVYLWLFGVFTLFTCFTRFLGLIGLWSFLTNKKMFPQGLLFIQTVVLFTVMYLFIGISRYRAPLEPILMIFAATALVRYKKSIIRMDKDGA